MNFQTIVVIVAIIILIGSLTFIGYTLHANLTNQVFPPVVGACPDYWVSKDNKCFNKKGLGKCQGEEGINFNTQFYQGNQGPCRKATWARNCGLSWGGLTNNVNICAPSN
jgi:hypothetical protein